MSIKMCSECRKILNCLTFAGSKEDSIISPTRKRRRNDNETLSISDTGDSILNDSNQWEMRILKADLIEANTKV